MTQPAISGVAVDTLLFSRIGVPLFHVTSLRRRHRRCAQDLVAWMSGTSLRDTEDRTADVLPRPKVTHRSVSRARRPPRPVGGGGGGGGSSRTTGSVCPHRSEANTVQALMDLALPRFEGLADGPRQLNRSWKISAESQASPDTSSVEDRRRSSSPCLNLDELLSSDNDTVGSVRLSDLSVTLLCGSDDDHTAVHSDQVLSDVDLPPESVLNDERQVIRIRDVSSAGQIVDISQVGRAWDSRRTVSLGGSGKRMPLPLCIPTATTSGRDLDVAPRSSGPDPPSVVGTVGIPAVESVEAVKLSSPPLSRQLPHASPQMVAWEDLGDSSVPLSPNRVQAGRSG